MRLLRSRPTILLIVLTAIALACGPPNTGSPPAEVTDQAGASPVLAISAVPRLQPPPGVGDYLDAAKLITSAGVHGSFESMTWSDLDRPGGRTKIVDAVTSAAGRGDRVLLTLKVLDTTVRSTPADLASSTFDSGAVTSRFHALLDALRPDIGGRVDYLSIGNEVDVYLAAHAATWDAYLRFYADAVSYVHATMPGVRVGVTSTFEGARGGSASRIAALNELSDVVVLTYYPLEARFVPRPPETAHADLAEMLGIAGGKPLVLQEVGYPSDPRLGSSERAQADFAAAVLAQWRAAGARIPLLNWFALHDFTPELCAQFGAYYGRPGDANFAAYLCSLGLRRVDGTPKAAWQTVVDRPRG